MAVKPTSNQVSPVGVAFLGAGTFIKAYGQYSAEMAQSRAEMQNAGFYRTQADFAQAVGTRQQAIFGRESDILYGEQQSAFAKAGIDTQYSSFFLANQVMQRQTGEYAIEQETAMNVKLARARADAAVQQAQDQQSAASNQQIGTFIETAATIAMFL